jgi:hypothetical protein
VEKRDTIRPEEYNSGVYRKEEVAMTLQTESGAPSFYTFPSFHPRRNALMYGAVLSLIAFCAVTLIFNYGIREKLWSYQAAEADLAYSATSGVTSSSSSTAEMTIRRISLPDGVLHSLVGVYVSAEVNRTYLITVDGPQIYLQVDQQEKTELIPVSDDTLYVSEGHLIKFAPDSAAVTRLDLYDNGDHILAIRQ